VKSQKHGKSTSSKAEISGITQFGIWMIINGYEYYLSYKEFPWFKTASVENLYNFEFKFKKYLRWPNLDIDLDIDTFKNLEKYPLKYIV
jgi:hypothetical protein